MTLIKRNYCFRGGIFIAAAFVAALAAASLAVIPAGAAAFGEAFRRPGGLFQRITVPLISPAPHAPLASVAGAALYALTALILIYHYFEKTNAPEIIFVALFALSLAFEGVRIMIPLKLVYGLPNLYLGMSYRLLLFARYTGIFSLFAASVCAAGLEVRQQRYIFLGITGAALVIALGLPVDTLAWDSSLSLLSGYTAMFRLMEGGLVLITALSFFIASYTRGTRGYILVGAGSLLVFLGRSILLGADTWLAPLPGLALLAAGTWFICTELHRIYLWL